MKSPDPDKYFQKKSIFITVVLVAVVAVNLLAPAPAYAHGMPDGFVGILFMILLIFLSYPIISLIVTAIIIYIVYKIWNKFLRGETKSDRQASHGKSDIMPD